MIMSSMKRNKTVEELIDDFLKDHPDFIQQNPVLLDFLKNDSFTKRWQSREDELRAFLDGMAKGTYEDKSIYRTNAPESGVASSPISSSYSKPASSIYSGGGSLSGYTSRGSRCFVATAVYDYHESKEVEILKQFRDEYLIVNPIGKTFVALYYKLGPRIAACLGRHTMLRMIFRALLYPIVKLCQAVCEVKPPIK